MSIGSPERPATPAVSTLLSTVPNAVRAASAPSVGAGATAAVCRRHRGRDRGRGRCRSWLPPFWRVSSACEQPHELAPSQHRDMCVLDPHQRGAGAARNDEFWGNLRPRALARARLASASAWLSAMMSSRARPRSVSAPIAALFVAPMALGAAGRKRVAGHLVATLKGALGLVVQRLADIPDRVDEVQAVRERCR